MLDNLLSLAAPHLCSGCGIEGTLLCENCKYNIISEPFSLCVACGRRLTGTRGICSDCKVSYTRAWCVADRRDGLQKLIDSYKFTNARAAYRPLANLLHTYLPELPANIAIVPVPTVSSHIRQRGYDHMLLIANELSGLRHLPVDTCLGRATTTKQRAASKAMRIKQAKAAFICNHKPDTTKTYLLIDDVITTGATVKYAAKALVDAGAREVWVAAISRQPLDK